MKNRIYEIRLRTPQSKLTTIIEALSGAAEITLIAPTNDEAEEPRAKKNMAYVQGKRDKGIRGDELALQILRESGRAMRSSEMGPLFAARGFAPTTASAALSLLHKEGRVRALGDGLWALPGETTVRMGAGC